MKKNYFLLLFAMISTIAFAQKPCTWGGDIAPTVPAGEQVSDTCYRVPDGYSSPVFDASGVAKIDNVWSAASVVEIAKHKPASGSYTPSPDPNIKAISQFMYDDNWMYILIVVSGDLTIDDQGSANEQDRVEFMFQNTFGGKGTAAEHCNDANWGERYWEQDGDRKFVMPINRATTNLEWLDQDLDNVCGGGDCGEVTGDDWLTYDALQILKYNVYTGNDSLIYECAFNLKNWMKYSYTDVSELAGKKFGFDFSVRDHDGGGRTDHINLNDPGDDAYAWTTVLADFTFSSLPLPPPAPSSINNKNNVQLSVFPNPATTSINIQADLNISKVEITNIVGQVVQTEYNVNSTVNVENLKEGLYILNVYSDNELIGTKKLFKQ